MLRLLSFYLCILLCYGAYGQSYRAMTYNIRYDNPNDGENQWTNRKSWMADQIKFHEPHILGIQEGLHHQVAYLDSALSEYNYVGVGRDDGEGKGEYSAIFHKNDLKVIRQSTFWLSDSPWKISVGWDASMERICTYALFQSEDNSQFWVFNTHFDHIGKEARSKSARLIFSKIKELNIEGLPVILMGDLNLEPRSEPIQYLSEKLDDTGTLDVGVKFGPTGTWNGFDHESKLSRRIDYIFVSEVRVLKYAVLSDSKDNRYPSDHLPVMIDFQLK